MVWSRKDMLDVEILQRDYKEADHHENDPSDSRWRKNFPDKKDRPDLGEEGGRTRDRVNQGEITSPIGSNKTDEIDRLEKAGGDGEAPEFGRGLKEEGWESSKGDEKWEVEKDSPQKNPEEEFSWPVPSLRKKIP